jgi:hypothetical protein
MRELPSYSIFRGKVDADPTWIEAVSGLSAAADRMIHIASVVPGPYFLYSIENREILATIDTSDSTSKQTKRKG